nr:para-hydroxybenzoic acid efflux pump subunit AaeB/fusaric acid resistance protein [Tanacetum cinerariifolium]
MKVQAVTTPHAEAIWRERLGSAFRTAIACTIIGCTALYGPEPVRHQIQYPSVAYVTAILIVSDATLGTTIRGSWNAFCATVIVVPSTVLCLWLVGPERFTETTAAVAVTLSAFLVALPECLPLLAKRVAFVQLVIIYVGAVVRGRDAGPMTHPVHIAACTALGASASVLALILPYPRLAVTEVTKKFHIYTENASERSSLYMKAFLSEDKPTAQDLISQAEPIAKSGTKLLGHINLIQEGVKWDRHCVQDFKSSFVKMGDRLENIETPIKGMEMALANIPSFPVDVINEDFKTILQSGRVQQILKLEHAKCFIPFDEAVTVPESKDELFDKSLNTFTSISPTHKHLPTYFFLSCFELLVDNLNMSPKPRSIDDQKVDIAEELSVGTNLTRWAKERLVFGLKCSLSLGLAVLLGMFFDKKNGYWSGLTIAISFVEGRLPIFTVANNRIQGTAIGSVYGVLGSVLLNQFAEIRFIILLPWIVFTSLLQHSQMFGESGGISAVIGALLILGRKNFGPPKQFAIARLTEVSIGLFCMVLLQILICNMELISSLSQSSDVSLKELHQHISGNLSTLKESTSPCVKRLQKLILVKSNDVVEHHLQEKERFLDLELASGTSLDTPCVSTEAAAKAMNSFVDRLKEATDKIQGGEACKGKAILHSNSLGFCIGSLTGETIHIEECIKDIIRSENPSRELDFNKLCYKI